MNNLERRVAEMEESRVNQLSNSKIVICGSPEDATHHQQLHLGEFRYIITGVPRYAQFGRELQAVKK